MRVDRRTALGAALAFAATPAAGATLAPKDPDETILLWPGGAPGGERVRVREEVVERSPSPEYRDRIAKHTTTPLLTVFRPARPDGSAMLLIPGGGYRWAVVDKEGVDVARVLSAAGVTCFVLRYRLPADGWRAGPDAPLQDAQRAIRLIRHAAKDYGIDSGRIGVLGASAGGHLAASAATLHDVHAYNPLDAADRLSARPDFAALLYPVITMADPHVHKGSREQLLGPTPTAAQIGAYSRDRSVNARTPPTFLVHALDDISVPVENSLAFLSALRAAAVPSEAHLYEAGAHGFGIRLAAGLPVASWPDLLLAWAARHGWLKR